MNNYELKIKNENKRINLDSNKVNNLIQNNKTRCNTND